MIGVDGLLFATPDEFREMTAALVRDGWNTNPLDAGVLLPLDAVLVIDATEEEQQRIWAGEDWKVVLGDGDLIEEAAGQGRR